ncbi:MAG: UDP-N-acetylmuramoyl-tripeptide--D-alanyl-D-alanine ligase [Treponema sp.]|nr:UDP-N-acetylmuramoyl-tripeptide--D-alanyl-D-alanine ligase [Treponema sp.]
MQNNESLLSLDELLKAVGGVFIGFDKNRENFCFTSVVTDSRNVKPLSLFVPLVGQNQDGHIYVEKAIESGATVIFINKNEYESNSDKYMQLASNNLSVSFISVFNTMTALQNAAAAYVAKFPKLIKVGITGSSGKTTTKEMVVSVLKQKYNVVYTQGNFNSETGLPLSVFNIRPEHEVGVFEMGMNRKNEIGEISAVLKAKYALVTNIGTAHIGILGSRKNIALEKRKIFKYIPQDGIAFIPDADDFKLFLGENVLGSITYYGESVPSEQSGAVFVKDLGLDGTIFTLDGVEIHLKNAGMYNYRNALGACAIGKALNVTPTQIKAGLENMDSVSGRMEIKSITLKNGQEVSLIKDCYNANPDSMSSVLDFCKTIQNVQNKYLVLGDMLELGEKSEEEHKRVVKKACEVPGAILILVGKEMSCGYKECTASGFNNVLYFSEHDDESIKKIASQLLNKTTKGDLILIKASRGIALERIISLIQEEEV